MSPDASPAGFARTPSGPPRENFYERYKFFEAHWPDADTCSVRRGPNDHLPETPASSRIKQPAALAVAASSFAEASFKNARLPDPIRTHASAGATVALPRLVQCAETLSVCTRAGV